MGTNKKHQKNGMCLGLLKIFVYFQHTNISLHINVSLIPVESAKFHLGLRNRAGNYFICSDKIALTGGKRYLSATFDV